MIAKYDFVKSQTPREVALPIHPAVTLEDWVGTVHIAMADRSLTNEQVDELMDQICGDPEALGYFADVCKYDELIASAYTKPRVAELERAEAVASPIW